MFRHTIISILEKFGLKTLPNAVINKSKNIMGEEKNCSSGCGACCVVLSIDYVDLQKPINTPCPHLTSNYECSKMLKLNDEELLSIKTVKQGPMTALEFCGHWTCRKASIHKKWILFNYINHREKAQKEEIAT